MRYDGFRKVLRGLSALEGVVRATAILEDVWVMVTCNSGGRDFSLPVAAEGRLLMERMMR